MCKLIPVIRRRWGPWLGFGMFTIVAAVAALESSQAQDPSNPYWVIIERNPFDLQEPPPPPPPPPPPETNDVPEPVEVDVKLTGFSMFGEVAQVYLMIPADKENPNPRFLTLAENDIHDDIEVVSIDPANETVRIRNAGKVADLTFEEHGLKTAAAPAKPRPAARGRRTATTSRATAGRTTTSSTANRVTSGRRTPGATRSSTSSSGGRGGLSSGTAGSSGIPTRQLPRRNMRTYTAGTKASPEYETGGDEIAVRQILQMEAQRAANPNIQLPPTPFIPSMNAGGGAAP